MNTTLINGLAQVDWGSVFGLAVGIRLRDNSINGHSVILLKDEQSSISLIHVMTNGLNAHKIQSEDGIKYYVSFFNTTDPRYGSIFMACKLLACGQIPNLQCKLFYDLAVSSETNISILDKNLDISFGGDQIGFTCATFVYSLLKSHYYDFIDFSSWDNVTNDDIVVYNELLDHIDSDRANYLRNRIHELKRISPLQVSVAFSQQQIWPMTQQSVNELIEIIKLNRFKGH